MRLIRALIWELGILIRIMVDGLLLCTVTKRCILNSTNGEVKDLIFGKDIRMIKVCIMLLLVFTH